MCKCNALCITGVGGRVLYRLQGVGVGEFACSQKWGQRYCRSPNWCYSGKSHKRGQARQGDERKPCKQQGVHAFGLPASLASMRPHRMLLSSRRMGCHLCMHHCNCHTLAALQHPHVCLGRAVQSMHLQAVLHACMHAPMM